jgi:hypothetical protein
MERLLQDRASLQENDLVTDARIHLHNAFMTSCVLKVPYAGHVRITRSEKCQW